MSLSKKYDMMEKKFRNDIAVHVPKNGMYITKADFGEWSNFFADIYPGSVIGDDIDISNPVNEVRSFLTKTITFVVTERCNLRCTYCYESHECHQNGKRMTPEIAKKAVDMLFDKEMTDGYIDSNFTKGVIVEFIGGEPLLEIDLIDYICDYFKYKAHELNHPWGEHFCFNMSSNGLLYMNEKVQKWLEKNKGCAQIGITIDGNKQLHDACRLTPSGEGSYDIVEKSVKYAIEHNYMDETKLTIAPENVDYIIDAFINLWENVGLRYIPANCVFEQVWNMNDAVKFYKILKDLADYMIDNEVYKDKGTTLFDETIGTRDSAGIDRNYCGGNGAMLAIGPDGTCYPCLRYMGHSMSSGREPFVCGHVDTGLLTPEKDCRLCELCKVTYGSCSPDKCITCPISTGCGYCTALNYDITGDPNKRVISICEMHTARVLANVYFWNTLYAKLGLNTKFDCNVPKEWALQMISEEEYEFLLKLSKGDDL